jgi:AcrR family transcriptional regulator
LTALFYIDGHRLSMNEVDRDGVPSSDPLRERPRSGCPGMTPRRYTLGRRAETAGATREAIVDAAMAVYLEMGVGNATLKAIAARADVARGTILHHFGDAEGLLRAVVDRLLTTLELPDERVLDGVSDPEARIRTFVRETVLFFRRTLQWWQVFESSADRPAYQAGEAQYFDGLGRLQTAALGPALADDTETQAVIGAIVHPGTVGSLLWALEATGVTGDDAVRVVEDLVVGYLRQGSPAWPARGPARDPGPT